jgi:hypothetical protein
MEASSFDDAEDVDNSQLAVALGVSNRRRAPRVHCHIPLQFRTMNGREGDGVTLNLSLTGARVVFYSHPEPQDDMLLLRLGDFQLLGRRVWEKPILGRKSYVAGVHFEFLNPLQRESLETLLKQSPN